MPPEVAKAYAAAEKLLPRGFGNIALMILDKDARVISAFGPFPGTLTEIRFDAERMGQYVARKVEAASKAMGLPEVAQAAGGEPEVYLPGRYLEGAEGSLTHVRVILSLDNGRPAGYLAPVVEVVEVEDAERSLLEWASREGEIEARALGRWLGQIYPPARMSSSGALPLVEGTLQRKPAGKDSEHRYATLCGKVRMTLDEGSGVTYEGELEAVLIYGKSSSALEGFRAVYRGFYPEPAPRNAKRPPANHGIAIEAVIESLPD